MSDINTNNIENVEESGVVAAPEQIEEITPTEEIAHDTSLEEGDEEVKQKKRRTRDKIAALNSNIWQLIEENRTKDEKLRQLEEEKQILNEQLQQSANITLNHYDNTANLRFEQAKQKLAMAEEAGDIPGKVDAIAELQSAAAEAQRAKEWKAQLAYKEQIKQENANRPAPPPLPIDERLGHAWVQNNTWYNPSSTDYVPTLAEPVRLYAQQVDNMLVNTGQSHLIYSPEYFKQIETYAQQVASHLNNNGRGLNMKQNNGGVAPVSRQASDYNQINNYKLSAEDKLMARRYGISEQVYEDYIKKFKADKRNIEREYDVSRRNGRV